MIIIIMITNHSFFFLYLNIENQIIYILGASYLLILFRLFRSLCRHQTHFKTKFQNNHDVDEAWCAGCNGEKTTG